jgi:hypothetical protein
MSSVDRVVRERADKCYRLGPTPTSFAEAKSRQASKIKELKVASIQAGFLTLDEQAKALGLNRSTAWNVIRGNHKTSGLSASIIIRMLFAPNLPPLVRCKLLEYIQEKISGVYGHNPKQLRRFSRRLKQHLEKIPVAWVRTGNGVKRPLVDLIAAPAGSCGT